jgi:hypothetical protein
MHGQKNIKLSGCVLQSMVTFVNYVCTIKLTQSFGLGIPLLVSCVQAAHKPPHNNGCCPLQRKKLYAPN